MQEKPPKAWTNQHSRRKSPRARVLFAGKIVLREGAETLDCTITDLSKEGARVRLPRGQGLPSRVFFLDIHNRTAHEATVTWLRSPLAGLRFDCTYSLTENLPEPLQYLRKIWIECAAR